MAAKKTTKRPSANREKSAVFSTRMDPDLRRRLEASAEKNSGGNLSRELDKLLKTALAVQKDSDEQLRAVIYLVSQLARIIPKWKNDAFMFRSFQIGVFALLDRLAPEGEEVAADLRAEAFPDKSEEELAAIRPEDYGLRLSSLVWMLLEEIERQPDAPSRSHYWALPKAREALKIKSRKQLDRDRLAKLLMGESK